MATKQQIIDALTPAIAKSVNARAMMVSPRDLAVLCGVDFDSLVEANAETATDPELAALKAKKARLEKEKLKQEIAELEAASEPLTGDKPLTGDQETHGEATETDDEPTEDESAA